MEWALLAGLSLEDRRQVLAASNRRRFARGQVIFHEGDPGDTLHLLAKGHVAVRVATPMGDTAMLRVLGPGDFFGELAVISPAPRNATVTAIGAVETLSLHRHRIDALRTEHTEVDRLLLEAAVVEIRRLSTQLLDALYVPVPKRVLRRVAEVAKLFAGGGVHDIPLTQDDIADLAGTSRPTANRVLRDAQAAGLLEIRRGHLSVLDAAELAKHIR